MLKSFKHDPLYIELTTYKKLICELCRTDLFSKKDSLNKKLKIA